MMIGHSLRYHLALCALVGCTLASCGSKNDAAGKNESTTTESPAAQNPSTPSTPDAGSTGAVEGFDACSMLTVDEVSAIIGVKMKTDGSQNNGCTYAPGEGPGLFGGVTMSVIDNKQAYDVLASGDPVPGLGDNALIGQGSLTIWKGSKGVMINFINPPATMDSQSMLKRMGEKVVARM